MLTQVAQKVKLLLARPDLPPSKNRPGRTWELLPDRAVRGPQAVKLRLHGRVVGSGAAKLTAAGYEAVDVV